MTVTELEGRQVTAECRDCGHLAGRLRLHRHAASLSLDVQTMRGPHAILWAPTMGAPVEPDDRITAWQIM